MSWPTSIALIKELFCVQVLIYRNNRVMKKPVLLKKNFQTSQLSLSPRNKRQKNVTEAHKGLRMQRDKETEMTSL